MDSNKNTPVIQQHSSEQSGVNNEDEVITARLTLAGLKVLVVRKGDQIIYKLSDNKQVASIGEEQRQQLMKEIQAEHLKEQERSNIQHIAPKSEPPSLDTPPQPTAAEADAIKETARKLREEFEQQMKQQQQQQQQTYSYDANDNKTTRRYNKTGKYSKKKQQQMQQQLHQQFNQQLQQLPFQQQQQLTQQQLLALQQSLQNNGVSNINTMLMNNSTPTTSLSASAASTPNASNTPMSFNFQQQQVDSLKSSPAPTPPPVTPASQRPNTQQKSADSILAKRLPEEELQHREVKKRFIEALINDQKAVTTPDYETPFTSMQDAMDRLLPYHIYQYPKGDLDANKIPLERQDHTMIEIFKCQVELFDKHAAITKKIEEDEGKKALKILVQRQVLAEQRQKLTEEQARVAAEQAAQQQETLRLRAEKARQEQEARQQQPLQPQQQFQQQQLQPQLQHHQILQLMQHLNTQQQQPQSPTLAQTNYANGLAQASALLTNPQFQSQYNQLSPELQERLQRNRDQLVALIEKQQQANNMNTTQ